MTAPCAPARTDVDSRCAAAGRLAEAAVVEQSRLSDVRRQLHHVSALRDFDATVRNPRELNAAKDTARLRYHAALVSARSERDVREAARTWLRAIDELNRDLAIAQRRAQEIDRQYAELEQSTLVAERAANRARIAADGAQAACLDARRKLAACEEDAYQSVEGPPPDAGTAPISLMLRGDREMLLRLARRLADETGAEPGRLQLLLLELREAIAERALADQELGTPDRHPFWAQFDDRGRAHVIASLAAMGYRFDGVAGWVDDRAPTMRELVIAVSHAGLDPRSVRRPASQEAVDTLWDGTNVLVERFLGARAPDLDLERLVGCLGPRATRFSELWDMWGRLRPLLLTPAA